MRLSKSTHKQTLALSIPIVFLALIFQTSLVSVATGSEAAESKVKKIVMMLNISSKEYALGIQSGQVINSIEYEESLEFMQQAFERYSSIAGSLKNSVGSAEIDSRFKDIAQKMKGKANPEDIRGAVGAIQSQLLKDFGIEMKSAPTRAISLDNGKKIYTSYCMLCHGPDGKGDGPLASQLEPKPAVLADAGITGDAETAAYDNFEVINVGIANTAMRGWSDVLTEDDIWDVTYYIRTFSNENVKLPLIAAGISPAPGQGDSNGKQADQVISTIRELLDKSFSAFKQNNLDDANETAFDAYLAYEKIEGGLINKRKELGLRLESSFSRLRGEIKRGASVSLVEKILNEIQTDLSQAQEVLNKEIGATGLFIQSLSIIVREGFEAILIIAALIAFLVKSRNEDKLKTIYLGSIIGIAGSFLTAYVVHEILNLSTASQELMEAVIMLIAVVLLFSVSYWLVSKIEAQKWQQYITSKMRSAVSSGNVFTLGAVAFLSVYREGFETVLFYKALYTYAGNSTAGIVPGFIVGCLCLAVIYYLTNRLGLRIPVRWFFIFTSIFLYYMAFTFMGKGLHELQVAGMIPLSSVDFIPQVTWLGVYPTLETFIGQSVLIAAYVLALIYTFGIKSELTSKQLKDETSHIQQDISTVHNLVEHISHHAKRCEVFLKDTKDLDLKELSGHLKEIDIKVHELSGHVRHVEHRLLDEYERLSQGILPKKRYKDMT